MPTPYEPLQPPGADRRPAAAVPAVPAAPAVAAPATYPHDASPIARALRWLIRVLAGAREDLFRSDGQAVAAVVGIGILAGLVSQIAEHLAPQILLIVLLAGYPATATIICAVMVWIPRGLATSEVETLRPGSWPQSLHFDSDPELHADYVEHVDDEGICTAADLRRNASFNSHKWKWVRRAMRWFIATSLVLALALTVGVGVLVHRLGILHSLWH